MQQRREREHPQPGPGRAKEMASRGGVDHF
jgi:hypothetical protein